MKAPSRFLHVANGTCTTSLIAAAGLPGARSIWADPLYEGPVPGGLTDEELIEVRARYLAGADSVDSVEPVNDLRRWRHAIDDRGSYDELVLWFEHDLFDQLNLIQILTWIRGRVPADRTVSLICIGSFPGRPRFKGLGELSPSELALLFDARQPIPDAAYRLAADAWNAFRDASPEALDRLRHADTADLPFLARAIERFLQEYPSTTDGLSRTERRLLSVAARAPIDVAAAFPRMHDDEDAYYVTDLSLAGLIDALSRTTPPLLAVTNGVPADAALHGTVHLTEAGRDVLAGRRDRVACGMDRWLGGVHLQDSADHWRWDDDRQQITRR